MTLPIMAATAREGDPHRNWRMREFLTGTLGLGPMYVPEDAPAAEAEAPAGVPQSGGQEDPGSEDETPAAGDQPPLEPYTLNSIAVPAKDEPAEADAEAGQ